jgi:hypothetical protein
MSPHAMHPCVMHLIGRFVRKHAESATRPGNTMNTAAAVHEDNQGNMATSLVSPDGSAVLSNAAAEEAPPMPDYAEPVDSHNVPSATGGQAQAETSLSQRSSSYDTIDPLGCDSGVIYSSAVEVQVSNSTSPAAGLTTRADQHVYTEIDDAGIGKASGRHGQRQTVYLSTADGQAGDVPSNTMPPGMESASAKKQGARLQSAEHMHTVPVSTPGGGYYQPADALAVPEPAPDGGHATFLPLITARYGSLSETASAGTSSAAYTALTSRGDTTNYEYSTFSGGGFAGSSAQASATGIEPLAGQRAGPTLMAHATVGGALGTETDTRYEVSEEDGNFSANDYINIQARPSAADDSARLYEMPQTEASAPTCNTQSPADGDALASAGDAYEVPMNDAAGSGRQAYDANHGLVYAGAALVPLRETYSVPMPVSDTPEGMYAVPAAKTDRLSATSASSLLVSARPCINVESDLAPDTGHASSASIMTAISHI